MVDESVVRIITQGVVAVCLIVLAGYQLSTGQAVDAWLVVAITAVLGVLFGFASVNGYLNRRKRGR